MSRRVSRRKFAQVAVAGGAVLGARVAGAAGRSGAYQLHVCSVSELVPGVVVHFRYPDDHAAWIVRLRVPADHGVGPNAEIVAYHTACPHMGCPLPLANVDKLADGVVGPCPCHRSTFDACKRGRQIFGRASTDMVRVLLEVNDGEVYAVGVEGLPFGEPLSADLA